MDLVHCSFLPISSAMCSVPVSVVSWKMCFSVVLSRSYMIKFNTEAHLNKSLMHCKNAQQIVIFYHNIPGSMQIKQFQTSLWHNVDYHQQYLQLVQFRKSVNLLQFRGV